ncbi:MAG: hypothetical protein JWM86_2343 [Thermoleophilia bacterium]|nr:hypothetical protein [Thermoleophilia bacterium]
MRRILLIALSCAAIAALGAGAASAQLDAAPAAAKVRAPFLVPAAAPIADTTQEGAYGYRSSEELADELRRDAAPASTAPAPAGGATISVSAVVLATVIVTVDADGAPVRIQTNTEQRDPADVVYVFRAGSDAGPYEAPTAATWAATRAALADATAGVGTIWQS